MIEYQSINGISFSILLSCHWFGARHSVWIQYNTALWAQTMPTKGKICVFGCKQAASAASISWKIKSRARLQSAAQWDSSMKWAFLVLLLIFSWIKPIIITKWNLWIVIEIRTRNIWLNNNRFARAPIPFIHKYYYRFLLMCLAHDANTAGITPLTLSTDFYCDKKKTNICNKRRLVVCFAGR